MDKLRHHRLLASVLIGALLLLLAAACGQPGAAQSNQPTATPTPTQAAAQPTATATLSSASAASPTATPTQGTPYFQGKTIRLVVTSSPGGGTDTQARYLAAKWSQFIPGHPRITVSNIRRTAGSNYVWNAKADGTTLLFQALSDIDRMVTDPQAQYDLRKVHFIGGFTVVQPVFMTFDSVPYKSVNDAMGKTQPVIRYALEAPSAQNISSADLSVMAMATFLNLPFKFLPVAKSSTGDVMLMYQRGEVDSIYKPGLWTQIHDLDPGWQSQGKIKPFAIMGLPGATVDPNPEGPANVPSVGDLVPKDKLSLWEAITGPSVIIGKNMWAPPGTPDSAVQILQNAAQAAMQDPTFLAGYQKLAGADTKFTPASTLEPEIQQGVEAYVQSKDAVTAFQQQMFNQWFK